MSNRIPCETLPFFETNNVECFETQPMPVLIFPVQIGGQSVDLEFAVVTSGDKAVKFADDAAVGLGIGTAERSVVRQLFSKAKDGEKNLFFVQKTKKVSRVRPVDDHLAAGVRRQGGWQALPEVLLRRHRRRQVAAGQRGVGCGFGGPTHTCRVFLTANRSVKVSVAVLPNDKLVVGTGLPIPSTISKALYDQAEDLKVKIGGETYPLPKSKLYVKDGDNYKLADGVSANDKAPTQLGAFFLGDLCLQYKQEATDKFQIGLAPVSAAGLLGAVPFLPAALWALLRLVQ